MQWCLSLLTQKKLLCVPCSTFSNRLVMRGKKMITWSIHVISCLSPNSWYMYLSKYKWMFDNRKSCRRQWWFIKEVPTFVLTRNIIMLQHHIIQLPLYNLSSSGCLLEVKNKRKFPTFSSKLKSSHGHLWEMVTYKRFQILAVIRLEVPLWSNFYLLIF